MGALDVTPFPAEFEALLSAEGRRVLKGRHPACGVLTREAFFTSPSLLDAKKVSRLNAVVHDAFKGLVREQVRALQPARETEVGAPFPKVGRIVSTRTLTVDAALLELVAAELGLWPMLASESCRRFCEQLSGLTLSSPFMRQVLGQRPGDYSGPHCDHLPEHPRARDGYVDLHFSFATRGVTEQLISYGRDGRFVGPHDISQPGTLNLYRLPVWHATTPLQARSPEDRRWLVLTSFFPEPTAG